MFEVVDTLKINVHLGPKTSGHTIMFLVNLMEKP